MELYFAKGYNQYACHAERKPEIKPPKPIYPSFKLILKTFGNISEPLKIKLHIYTLSSGTKITKNLNNCYQNILLFLFNFL